MPVRFPLHLALAWTVGVTAALWLGVALLFAAFPRAGNGIVWLGLVQVAAYAVVLLLFATARGAPLSDVLALRRAPIALCLASVALGVALQVPATLLSDAVERLFPSPSALLAERALRVTPHSTREALAIFLTVAVLGPCVEELFFRGALFGALRRGHGALITAVTVAVCFAFGHLDLRLFLPLFVAALALGQVREYSGSVWPGVALHGAFNATTLAVVFCGAARDGKPPSISFFTGICGSVATLLLLRLTRRYALASSVARLSRARDGATTPR